MKHVYKEAITSNYCMAKAFLADVEWQMLANVVLADVEPVESDTESSGADVLPVPAPVPAPRRRRGNLPVVTPRRWSETNGDVNWSTTEQESVNTDVN